MALPEIIKDIDARVIRPTSTDNAIVRFDGTTGQIQNTANIIDDSNNTLINGTLKLSSYNGIYARYIDGSLDGYSGELYLNYHNNAPIILGHDGGYYISADGSFYSGTSNKTKMLQPKEGNYTSIGDSGWAWNPWNESTIYYVWGQSWVDSRLPSDSGDIVFYMTPSTTLNMNIDGAINCGKFHSTSYAQIGGIDLNYNLYVQGSARISSSLRVDGSITNLAVNGGIYWNPYVESSSDPTDAASITLIPSGCLGGTELRIQQANDSNDTINFYTPAYLCGNGKIMFGVYDNWLRINEPLNFTGGVYFGGSVVRIDNGMFQIGDSGSYVAISTNGLQIGKGVNVSGNSLGSGLELWNDSEGGNITIYSGNCGTYGSYSWNIDAFNGNLRMYNVNSSGNYTGEIHIQKDNVVLYGAAWNDYAEYRESDITQPGRCIIENGDDTLSLSTERLQRGAEIVSDTFGFAIGETDTCKTPIAASGRVLTYGYEDREQFKSHIGYPVCSGPNGTVSIMTDEEEQLYPSRIIGYISAVPDYEIWGTGNVKVDGRIWIRIK